ncbi:nitroreductase family deazaflavin-dependent oxidoreductase [Myceligenerans pegani]|uniref:Nitroreductase family deazaflavin-dependent oxidoreductase n=1 Tax=Myceligenerans pegani TaxID=2776917 RepID=A0ABR9MXY4_9MICO|nr:nitroreductase family deazaflavin-dependent oxidoreductase [Myceligenerans sp. TRM 65318]MBE1875647.1 nitroreductase family deazaflavin-dependent oxidoreductase [Myceligenerans sp. TRM 65318]MBE3017918.1 nitroreductase family deazaflavin-dependent oxidoreductase [Myceligenerans sp. TRM 65318]
MSTVLTVLGVIAGAVVLVPALALVVLLIGFRTQNARILGTMRRFNRAVTNRAQRAAGTEGNPTGLLHHRGRTSGREYVTPIGPSPEAGGFVVALPYGPGTDWLRNLQAAGSGVLEFDGRTYRVDHPEVVPIGETVLAEREARTIRAFNLEHALRLRATEQAGP